MVFSSLEDPDNIRGRTEEEQPERWHWGNLPKFEIPQAIIRDGQLVLNPPALKMLLILACGGKTAGRRARPEPIVEVGMGHKLLSLRSGYSKDRITAGLEELKEKGFIQPVESCRDRGLFGSKSYLLCNPFTRKPLEPTTTNIYYRSPRTVPYLPLPTSLIYETRTNWCLASVKPREIRLYLALCWLANKKRTGDFLAKARELKKLGSFSNTDVMQRALAGLECRGLVDVQRDGTQNLTIQLLDPRTGDPPYSGTDDPRDDPANYWAIGPRGGKRPLHPNSATSEQRLRLLLDSLPPSDPVVHRPRGVVFIRCPLHPDNTPSCSVDTRTGGFNCLGCGKHGRFRELIGQLCGLDPGESIAVIGRGLGVEVVYREPPPLAGTTYDYFSAEGVRMKGVVRGPNKTFRQGRPTSGGGWIWNLDGVPPMLYNLPRLQFAQVVCICEGEKDCETFDSLSLHSALGGDVVPTTSGSADSWHDELADTLRGKRVILMPDDDEPGARYAASIRASLHQRDIEYRTVSFHGDGAKDLSDFIAAGHTKEELVERIGRDWVAVVAPSPFDAPAEFAPA
jgi:5S rRNA maturation endonuclease (ribonuclease M5)